MANERRLLATKRITKIYEVPGFPMNNAAANQALRKIQAKTSLNQ